METKHTKEYAELQAKKAYLGTKHSNNEINAFTYGYLHSIEETGVADLLEALMGLKISMDETIRWTNGGLESLSILEQERYKIICNAIKKATIQHGN